MERHRARRHFRIAGEKLFVETATAPSIVFAGKTDVRSRVVEGGMTASRKWTGMSSDGCIDTRLYRADVNFVQPRVMT